MTAATYEPLSVPRIDRTADAAIARVGREPMRRLEVPLSEWCGERLIEAFLRIYGARFTGR